MSIAAPPWAERFRSDDLDEIRERLSRFGSHRRERRGRGPLGFHVTAVPVGGSALGWGGASLGQIVHAETTKAVFHLPIDRRVTYRSGRRLVEASPERAVFIPPGTTYTAVSLGGSWLAAQLDDGALVDELARLEPGCAACETGITEIPLDSRRKKDLLEFFHEATSLGPFHVARGGEIEARLVSWVADKLMPGAPRASERGWLGRQHRVEEWIEAHLAETITLGHLCALADVGARALQKSFMDYRGQSPMEWVASRRLAAARLKLFESTDGDSVTAIALQSGLSHLGRFAESYKRAYGESPSESLARRRLALS